MNDTLKIVATPGKPTIVITRMFDAPRALVFEAMSKPEHVRTWWGPKRSTMVSCAMDLRVGGAWRFVLRNPDGREDVFRGEYREIVPGRRIVQTFLYDVDFLRDHPAVETMELENVGGRTRMTTTVLHDSVEMRDGHIASGMEGGMRETFARLDQALLTIDDERPSIPTKELVLVRTFDAPRALVFQAWTDPKMVARWWCPDHFTIPRCEIDLRPGGAIRVDMRAPDGQVFPMIGTYLEVVPPERLVFVAGAMHGPDGSPGLETRDVVTFTEENGKTTVRLVVEVVRATPEAMPALAGMEEGWRQSLAKLPAVVAR